MTIETDRLILRKFTLEDAEEAFHMNNDPEVMKYIIGERFKSVDEVKEMIKKNVFGDYEKHGYGRMAITLKPSNKFIGFTGLKYNDDFKEVDLGYRLMRKYWGKGIATESSLPFMNYGFNQLGLKRIVALAFEGNIGSIKIMKKVGMIFEKYMVIDGHELVCYAKNHSSK